MRCSEGREVVEHCSHPPLFAVVVCVSAGPLEPHVLARVGAVMDDFLTMSNLDSLRDWGHARFTSSAGCSTRSVQSSVLSVRNLKSRDGRTWPPSHSRRPAGTVHWASGPLRNLAPPALSRAAAASTLTPVSGPKLSVRPRLMSLTSARLQEVDVADHSSPARCPRG